MGKLTERFVKTAPPGRHHDGDNLILSVKPTGARSWICRVTVQGKKRDIGLGGYPLTTLAEAREKAIDIRRAARDNKPVVADREASSFAACAEAFIKMKTPGWENAKTPEMWRASLATYAFPIIGKMRVNDITANHLLDILKPIWTTKTETAGRVRSRIEAILDYAKTRGFREGDNPARWKGCLEYLLPKPGAVAKVTHHAALPYKALPAFWQDLSKRTGSAARCLEWIILTISRSGEGRGARFDELSEHIWTVPAKRMKQRKKHRVPICKAAAQFIPIQIDEEPLMFPSEAGTPLSDMAFSSLLKRMKVEVTTHGFRSTFRDWAAEQTDAPREIIEMCLAHAVYGDVEKAYARSDLLEKRRALMERWTAFVTGGGDGR